MHFRISLKNLGKEMTFHKFLSLVEFYTGNKNWFTDSRISINQREIVDLIHSNKFSVIYKNRQAGVSTILGLYILWRTIETPGISIALFSHRNSQEIFRKNVNRNLEKLKISHKIHTQKKTQLDNGSVIYYFSGQSPEALRGWSFDIITFDDLPTDYLNRFLEIPSIIPIATSRHSDKIIISTSELSLKTTIDNIGVNFQEVYGNFFNGKREVITEKIKHSTS